MDPTAISTIATLVQTHAWLALALFVIPMLDKMISEGQWPFALIVSVRVRLILIALGGATVGVLQHVQSGGAWVDSIMSGALVLAFALLKNGGSLFSKGAIPAAAAKVASLGLLCSLTLGASACAGWQKEAKSVLDVATTVCVLANAMSTNAEIMTICGIEQSLAPAVDAILSEQRAQLKASALRVCK